MMIARNYKFDGNGYLSSRGESGYLGVHRYLSNQKWYIRFGETSERVEFRLQHKSAFSLSLKQYAKLAAVVYELYPGNADGFPEIVQVHIPGSQTLYLIKKLKLITTRSPATITGLTAFEFTDWVDANTNSLTSWLFEPVKHAEDLFEETDDFTEDVEDEEVTEEPERLDSDIFIETFYKELKRGTFDEFDLHRIRSMVDNEMCYGEI